MNCPNCGTYYDENEKICKKCHTPLSNAVYNQVSSGNDINQPAPKRKSFVPIVVAILIWLPGSNQADFHLRQKYGLLRRGSFRFTGTTEVRTKRKRTRKTTIKNIHR